MEHDREIALRRAQNTLRICGGGAIAFGLWSVLKVYLSFFFGEETIDDLIRGTAEAQSAVLTPEEMRTLWIVMLVITFLVGLVVFGVHLYVGLRAIRASGGNRKPGGVYLVWAGIFALFALLGILLAAQSLVSRDETRHISLASLMIDVTSLYLYVDLIRSAVRVGRYQAQLRPEEGK